MRRNAPTTPTASSEEGFTLIEVMIALMLLLVGMTGVALAQLYALRSSSNSAVRSRAFYLAEEQLEVFQAMNTADVMFAVAAVTQDANPIDPNPGDDDFTPYFRCWQMAPNTPVAGLTTITVEVRVGDPACNPADPNPPFGVARVTGIK